MKALSIIQPWPYAIIHLGKPVENRSWRTHFRGRFLIHASRGFDEAGYRFITHELGFALPPIEAFPRGGIVGSAVLRDCVRSHDSEWFCGPFGFVLQGVKALPLIPCRGFQGFWDVPAEIEATVVAEAMA